MTTAADNPASKAAQGRSLSDERLKELMRLMRGAHSVELKLTVPLLRTAPPFRACRWIP